MPYISQARREELKEAYDDSTLLLQPGDRCYLFYKEMVRKWKAHPRWTTAHEIYKELLLRDRGKFVVYNEIEGCIKRDLDDDYVAQNLAWQIFFQWWVIPYEKEAEKRNGQIE